MLDFLKELTRRKVWLFGGIYLGLGWILLQVAALIENTLSLPGWVDQITLVLLGLGFPVALLLAWAQESQSAAADTSDTAKEQIAAPTADSVTGPSASERPSFSIAVLPFDDLSSDGAFGESADAISEDALTQLSQFGALKVAARNSSFAYKGASFDMRDIGRQLEVRFILEGSLRSRSEMVRITAQLIDTLTGDHVWSRNFDVIRADIETGLDDVVDGLAGGISGTMINLETQRLEACPKNYLSADDLMNLAKFSIGQEGLQQWQTTEALLEASLAKRPDHAQTLAYMGQVQMGLARMGAADPEKHKERSEECLVRAKAVGRPDFETLIPLAATANMVRRVPEAEALVEQMREMAPRHPATWAVSACCNILAGRHEDALAAARKAKSFTSIRGPQHANLLTMEGIALVGLGNYAEAEACARKSLATTARSMARFTLVVSLAQQGRLDEARAELDRIRADIAPEVLTMQDALETRWLVMRPKDDGRWREGLALAGLEDDVAEPDPKTGEDADG